ncbi:MAG: hypothetical protein M3401_03285 [Actinomycetota bacterium]|nr:hypothetical protein [Actinomycetota bacterium]
MPAPRFVVPHALAVMALVLAAPVGVGCGDSDEDKSAGTATRTTSAAETAIAGRLAAAQDAARAAPNDPDALKNLARAHVELAYARGNVTGNTIGVEGEAQLREAAAAWERYLARDPGKPDVLLATVMARAFAKTGLDEPRKAIRALRIAAEHRTPPNGNLYAQLAVAYYGERRFREGDLAASRAAKLAPPNERSNLRRSLRQIRSHVKAQGA